MDSLLHMYVAAGGWVGHLGRLSSLANTVHIRPEKKKMNCNYLVTTVSGNHMKYPGYARVHHSLSLAGAENNRAADNLCN